jgi:radical SAM superfamily enzyme YgiQ (UPF0313 family)
MYFMIGLPGETDEDVAAIGRLAKKCLAVAQRALPKGEGSAAINLGASTFVPKPFTPFQWEPMIGPDETLEVTGHPVGGVCPFGLKNPLPVYLDASLKSFDTVYPAGGSLNTSVRITPARLFALVGERWVDVMRLPEADGA